MASASASAPISQAEDQLDKLIDSWDKAIGLGKYSQFVEEFEKILPHIPYRLQWRWRDIYPIIEILKKLAESNMNLTKYVSIKLEKTDQPVTAMDLGDPVVTYTLVKKVVDSLLTDPPTRSIKTDQQSSGIHDEIIRWSLNLWFLQRLYRGSPQMRYTRRKEFLFPFQSIVMSQGCKIFKKYFLEGNKLKQKPAKPSFHILFEDASLDLVKLLFLAESDDEFQKYFEYFEEQTNIALLCEEPELFEKGSAFNSQLESQSYFFIPKNDNADDVPEMYGAHIYLLREEGVSGYINFEAHGDIPAEVEGLMGDVGFNRLIEYDPETWRTPDVLRDVQANLQIHPCSLLFISFYTHGVNRHFHDQQNFYAEYDVLLKMLNMGGLENIPKIIFIQACAGYPEHGARLIKYAHQGGILEPDGRTMEFTRQDAAIRQIQGEIIHLPEREREAVLLAEKEELQRRVNEYSRNTLLITSSKPGIDSERTCICTFLELWSKRRGADVQEVAKEFIQFEMDARTRKLSDLGFRDQDYDPFRDSVPTSFKSGDK